MLAAQRPQVPSYKSTGVIGSYRTVHREPLSEAQGLTRFSSPGWMRPPTRRRDIRKSSCQSRNGPFALGGSVRSTNPSNPGQGGRQGGGNQNPGRQGGGGGSQNDQEFDRGGRQGGGQNR